MTELKLPREAEKKNEIKPERIELLKDYSDPFWSMPWQSVLKRMKSSEDGLTDSEVATRLLRHGKNEIIEDGPNKISKIVISNVLNPIFYVIFAIALASFFLAELQTAVIICVMALLFFILRFMQDYSSESALKKLKNNLTFSARVLREGWVTNVDTKEIVPGDMVVLSDEDRVPADIRLIDTNNLRIDESTLTGERYPVEKTANVVAKANPIPQHMSNMAFAGSTITDGRAVGVVVATGIETQFGKKAFLLDEINDNYKFKKELKKLGGSLIIVGIVVFLFIFLINEYMGHNPIASLLFAATIATILASEPLESINTLFLSLEASKLSENGVTVKRLSAMEDLGNVDVICCDKTGTLTEGRINVADSFDPEGNRDDTPLLLSLQCSSVTSMKHHLNGNAIDVSLMEHSRRHPTLQLRSNRYSRVFEIPFDYERKRMSVVVKTKERNSKHILICKGAPEAILAVCTNTVTKGRLNDIRVKRKKIMERYIELSELGYNVIAVAIKEVRRQDSYTSKSEKDLTFLGFVTFIDPPRRNAKDIFELANRNGVDIKILSGDGATVTRAIANKVGLDVSPEQVLVGSELDDIIKKGDIERLERTTVFARVTPEQKVRIIRTLRSRGKIVAFVGGDLGDMTPLKEADLGISVQEGADAVKNESDIVMARKSLNSLMYAILATRRVFSNLMKYVRCTLAIDFGELGVVILSSAFLNFIILLPIQILAAKFLTDVPLLGLSNDNPNDQELNRPRDLKTNLITRDSIILGAINAAFGLVVVAFMINMGQSRFQSAVFLEIVLSGALVVLSLRTIKPLITAKMPSVWLLIAIALVSIVGITLILSPFSNFIGFETPLADIIISIIGMAIAYVLVTDVIKYLMYGDLEG